MARTWAPRLDLDRPHDAYRHLRYYTEIVAANAWAWCFRRAAEALARPPRRATARARG